MAITQVEIRTEEHTGTVLCVERNEARPHGEDCTEARTQRTVPLCSVMGKAVPKPEHRELSLLCSVVFVLCPMI